MKKIILMILIICFSFLISCTKNVDVNVTKDDTDVIKRLNKSKDISKEFKVLGSSKSKSKKIYANEYLLPVPTGGEIGDQTSYKDKIYYTVLYMRHMTNFATKAEIYSYDINHKTSSLIYEYTNPQGDIYLNELRANEKNLFWEIINPSQNWGLYKFDLKNKELKTIRTSKETNSDILPCIALSDEYLSWYETKQESEDIRCSLIIYYIENDIIQTIDNNVYLISPYYRAFIRQQKVTFLTKNKEDIKINIYDLKTKEKEVLIIPPKTKVTNAISNGKYTVWHEDFRDTNIYVYDHSLDELFLINSKHNSQHLFALDLCKNYIFINDSKEDNIFLFDIKSKEKLNLTNNFNNNDNVYTLTTITSDEKFIAQNHTKEGVKCLLVELNE